MYNVELVKMIRNNNMVTSGTDRIQDSEVYFMLDYFDLMFHKSFEGKEKVYQNFWNLERDISDEALEYKSAYKTLSLYVDHEKDNREIWKREQGSFSATPFLGIIQINIVYHVYKEELEVEEILEHLEDQIIGKILKKNQNKAKVNFQMYRSSTSSDFCLVVRSNSIEEIFKISTLINNLIISYDETKFNFRTYTNVGIECVQNSEGQFQTFAKDIIKRNSKCKFSIRFTASDEFASKRYICAKSGERHCLLEHMSGLFGRYDFLVHLTMEEFSQIYPILCKSKTIGNGRKNSTDGELSLVELLMQGIENGDVQIINERSLVPLATLDIGGEGTLAEQKADAELLKEDEKKLRAVVKMISNELGKSIKEFKQMEGEFIEERRAFIDIARELKEVINTYVPQGMDHDSHVNWQMLISDLQVVFKCIDEWKAVYDKLKDEAQKKKEREHFLEDLRLITEAINQYYKFLQNVNAQTWQSPLYEIQTQLDAEKMMIAYREFLYEYFCEYQNLFRERPMFYPIIYPDMSVDNACIYAPFSRMENLNGRLLICKVPSFEYYGRVFDMVPWTLHEASHSIRTMKRKERNEYLAKALLYCVIEQALYKLLNKYSNDYGYHSLGVLEKRIIKQIVEKAYLVFINFCKEDLSKIDIYMLQTKMVEFLTYYFDDGSYIIEKNESEKNRKAIQAELLKYYAELGLLDNENIKKIESCMHNSNEMEAVLKMIYSTFFRKLWGQEPGCEQWKFITFEVNLFEKELQEQISTMEAEESEKREFCFKVREMNRLYSTWSRRGELSAKEREKKEVWKNSIEAVQEEIENGFRNHEGFTEIYRILNMVFGTGKQVSDEDIERVSESFKVLSFEAVYDLIEREMSIYRETCADLYMAATLRLNAFGYCRQIFQTACDIRVKDNMGWEEEINFHRFMMVTAVLLSDEYEESAYGERIRISAEKLCEQGKIYCLSTLECLRNKLLCNCNKDEHEKKEKVIAEFINVLKQEIEDIFKEIFIGDIAEILKYSNLVLYAKKFAKMPEDAGSEVKKRAKILEDKFRVIEKDLENYRHVLYRVQYFIYALSMIMDDDEISVESREFGHMQGLYRDYKSKKESKSKNDETISTVADFYNNPETAVEKSSADMLDDAIHFVEEYYYRNRFEIMSSEEIKAEVEQVEKEQRT